jgi:hypothetical protein
VKTDIDHLPEKKRDQIMTIASVIRSRASVEMVILFGSYARMQLLPGMGPPCKHSGRELKVMAQVRLWLQSVDSLHGFVGARR